MRNAKIVCTLGPASNSEGTIRDLAAAGMAVARINTSHADPESAAALAATIRRVDETTADPLATLLDLQGPEVRTAAIDGAVTLEAGTTVEFRPGDTVDGETVGLSTSVAAASVGDRILLDDGRIETRVEAVEGDSVRARVQEGGSLESRAGVNVPGVDLGLDPVTEGDRAFLEVAAESPVDYVAASFVRSADDVLAVSEVLEDHGADLPIIAKIERRDAVTNLEGIVDASYGIMVARGDLGVECPMEDVPLIQKRIIRQCRAAGAPVITATEMLDSMVSARRPTRAEASDVANAVLDGSDAVMLSGETAVGEDPVHVVETMDRIVRRAESAEEYRTVEESRVPEPDGTSTDALSRSARYLARDVGATAVVVASESGYTARKVSKFHPEVPIVAATPREDVRRQLTLSWGVEPVSADLGESIDDVIARSVDAALSAGVADSGDTVVVVAGMLTDLEGPDTTNMLKVHVAASVVTRGRTVVGGQAVGPAIRVPDGDLSRVPDGTLLVLPRDASGSLEGAFDKIAGIIDATPGLTGYGAMVARELDVPMISGAVLGDAIADGAVVTLDADRGVVYEGDVRSPGARR
ncbi:MAG: pyruvate kinase [Halobacteriaceae archaeon]